jgi:hypothetical protein
MINLIVTGPLRPIVETYFAKVIVESSDTHNRKLTENALRYKPDLKLYLSKQTFRRFHLTGVISPLVGSSIFIGLYIDPDKFRRYDEISV